MSLIPVDAEYHYVQDTAPTTANAADVWLDTSQNPPVAKIYADVGNGLEWVQDQSSNRIGTNLDAKVSEAGQGVDWAGKTAGFAKNNNTQVSAGTVETFVSISGSGYLIEALANREGPDGRDDAIVNIDGVEVFRDNFDQRSGAQMHYDGSSLYPVQKFNTVFRFDSSVSLNISNDSGSFSIHSARVIYVLD